MYTIYSHIIIHVIIRILLRNHHDNNIVVELLNCIMKIQIEWISLRSASTPRITIVVDEVTGLQTTAS